MIDQEFEELIKSIAEEYDIDPKQAALFKKVIDYLLKGSENKLYRAVLANPERFSGSGDFEKAIKEWIVESLINSNSEIIKIFPNRSQVIEFIESEYKANPDDDDIDIDDDLEIREFIRGMVNRSIGIEETEIEKFLRRFLDKSIRLARDHWKKFGNFEIGTPETSPFKKHENLIRGYLLVLGVLTPEPYSQYMSGYMNRYEQQKAEAFRTMDENPSFSWKDFAYISCSAPLDVVAAIFSAEIDPDVWSRRVEAIKIRRIKEGGDQTRKVRTKNKEYKIEMLRSYFESLQKENPEKAFKSIRDLCKEHFVGKEDHQMPEPTFFRLMKAIEKQVKNK